MTIKTDAAAPMELLGIEVTTVTDDGLERQCITLAGELRAPAPYPITMKVMSPGFSKPALLVLNGLRLTSEALPCRIRLYPDQPPELVEE